MRAAFCRLAPVCSRRALVLIMFGAVFLLVGYAQITTESAVTKNPAYTRAYAAHLELFELQTWGWLFVVSGAIALACALFGHQVVGFSVLMALASWWGLEFVATWIATGYDRAVLGALTWGLLVGLLAVIVGWKESPEMTVQEILREIDGE